MPAELARFDGMIHAFYAFGGMIPASGEALDRIVAAVRGATGRT